MARTAAAIEVNSFVKGLITEAGPLSFPEGASLDEDNFVLRRDGTRRRRLGMDFEEDFSTITTTQTVPTGGDVAFSTFEWENAGGVSETTLAVVQVGGELKFFNAGIQPLSSALLYTHTYTGVEEGVVFSYASVDGLLVVTTGLSTISVFEFDGISTITHSSDNLKIRDLFGVEDITDGDNLRVGTGVAIRPGSLTGEHNYNLRNQTWAEPRMTTDNNQTLIDPIIEFRSNAAAIVKSTKYPANSDSVIPVLYPDADLSSNRTADRFHSKDLLANPLGNTPAPIGHFIVDALSRGQSRLDEVQNLADRHSAITQVPTSLPEDVTPGGPTVTAEFAGHVWFGGFSSEVVNGDAHSPRLGSYLMFSQLVEDSSDITRCYQEADPTSRDQSDLVPTDGGFIRLDGAHGIKKLVSLGRSLAVFASNGVWIVNGGSDFGFTADNYLVTKITDRGCSSGNSAVTIDNTVMYWAEDAIYHVAPNQVGDYVATNMTQNTIQGFYNDIDAVDKTYATGIFDDFERKVRWLYNNRVSSTSEVKELVFDLSLSAFYTNTIKDVGTVGIPRAVAPLTVPPFKLRDDSELIVYGSLQVQYGSEDVTYETRRRDATVRETSYVAITQISPTIEFTFSSYRDEEFLDWKSSDGVGVDANGFLLTGYTSGGDFQRQKQVPYITFYFRRTEDGMTIDGNGDLYPGKPSGCIVQAQWEWTNSINAGRWGREFQAYRLTRAYMPSGIADPFDTGFGVTVTKSKLRGKGRVLSLYMRTEPGKDCDLVGWSMIIGVNNNV